MSDLSPHPGDRPATNDVPPAADSGGATSADSDRNGDSNGTDASGQPRNGARRRRGPRGGRGRGRGPGGVESDGGDDGDDDGGGSFDTPDGDGDVRGGAERGGRGERSGRERGAPRLTAPAAGENGGNAPANRPKIGDTRPAPAPAGAVGGGGAGRAGGAANGSGDDEDGPNRKRRRRGGRGRSGGGGGDRGATAAGERGGNGGGGSGNGGGNGAGRGGNRPVELVRDRPLELDDEVLERRRGRERKGRPVGRYLMVVHVRPQATQIAVLEGRALIEHYVSRPSDDATQIDGNIYLGRVQNVLPGMEAAFIDIGTPKNAVLYRGDVRYDPADVVEGSGGGGKGSGGGKGGGDARIEQLLKAGQSILCQVTKNPIGTKGARLTQEVSLPGRFCVLIPNSDTYGISKRLSDDERKRLRKILDQVKPDEHGLIVRTAAEGATPDELRRDIERLMKQWNQIDALAKRSKTPALLYREPDMAVRVIREEFNKEYRGVVIDDPALCEDVRDYVASISPELADRVEHYDQAEDPLPIFERFHIHEQLHKALDRKVWLPSGGSLIIERTEALTVIDVNTGKNVGTSNLEETVYRNNLEAAEEIAHQLRLRDIGGIIVIDFIDMEIAANRADVLRSFKGALARDKTRTQVFDISELGLVQMTRKRVSEGLVESFSATCPTCNGRGFVLDETLL